MITVSAVCETACADKATDDFNLGIGFYRNKRWEQAAETLGKFVQEFPEHPRVNVARLFHARSLSVLEEYAAARQEFIAFLNTQPESRDAADARYRLGECSYFLKDYPAASAQLSEYLRLHPEHSLRDWATLLLGDTAVALREYERAVELLTPLVQSTEKSPVLADARFSLGKAMEGLKRGKEALELYQAVMSEPASTPAPRALNRIGALQYAQGEFREAALSFEKLAGQYAGTSYAESAALGAGMSWHKAGDYKNSLVWLNRVPPNFPGAPQAIFMKAMSLKELGRIDESRKVFSDATQAAQGSPLLVDVLFQQALMERFTEQRESAVRIFEDIADRWPSHERTVDCLFNAAEMRLELGQQEIAERHWRRLSSEFAAASQRPREQIIFGRLLLGRGDTVEALNVLRKAVDAASDPSAAGVTVRVLAVGRYYLVRALYAAGEYDQVPENTGRMREWFGIEELTEIRGALALAALASLHLKNYQDVLNFADEFLPESRDMKQRMDVLSARAVALSHLKRYPECEETLDLLISSQPDEPQTWTAVLHSAEAAMEAMDLDVAERCFARSEACSIDPAVREAGLSGVGWSLFRAARYSDAEMTFANLLEKFPNSKDRAESMFMHARCVEEQGDAERSSEIWKAMFISLTEGIPPAVAGEESVAPKRYTFDAGRQAARSLEKLKRFDDAHDIWERLTNHFPEAAELDRLLDEWAWMNSSARRFDRSDQIHRTLLTKFPDSPFAGQARLSLAESLLESRQLNEALQEMEFIAGDPRYGSSEKERALFHVVEIQAAQRQWQPLLKATDRFLADYGTSPLSAQIRLFRGNAFVELGRAEDAVSVLNSLREDINSGNVPEQEWTDRVWIVMAEAELIRRQYDRIDELTAELKQRNEKSRFGFQMMDIQGRRWKQQAPPDFDQARRYFRLVTSDPVGRGTETAARCQFLIAETYVLQKKSEDAIPEYFKVYINYTYDDLRAQALFQAASCEVQLGRNEAAGRDFQEFIEQFPDSPLAARAREELQRLKVVAQ